MSSNETPPSPSGDPPAPAVSLPPASLCREALALSREAALHDEVPVGSLLCEVRINPSTGKEEWSVLATGRNRIVERRDPTAHGEMEALRMASRRLQSERLPLLRLVTTLEPCMMCTGALILARIHTIYYMAPELKGPGTGSLLEFSRRESPLNHYPRMVALEEYREEAAEIMKSYFRSKREK